MKRFLIYVPKGSRIYEYLCYSPLYDFIGESKTKVCYQYSGFLSAQAKLSNILTIYDFKEFHVYSLTSQIQLYVDSE